MSTDNNIDRELRRLKNYSQPNINVDGFSNRNLSEGDLKFTKDKTNLILNKKHKGLLWQSKFYKDGNQIVDKNLTVGGNLDVKGHIVGNTFKIIPHNMQAEINLDEVFLPWFGVKQASDLTGVSSSFLAPYSMTLKKIMFRPSAISSNASSDLTVKLYKMDDGDAIVDIVARGTQQPDLAGDTFFVLNRSDFDNNPKFEMGDNCGISIQAAGDYGSSIVWKITSVWEIEIKI